jgi:glycosyltransferase involved in cell wall biosynthesis
MTRGRTMRILIVSTVMPIRGGVGSHIDTIAENISKLGYETSVINVLGDNKRKFKVFSYRLIKFLNPILKNDLFFMLSFIAARLILRFKVSKEMVSNSDYIVHAHDINAFNALYKLCKSRNIKLVLTIHGFLHDGCISVRQVKSGSFLGRYLYNQELKAFKNAENIITISSYHTDVLRSITEEKKLHLIPNFIDVKLFYPYSSEEKKDLRRKYGYGVDDFILIYTGRLEKSKGLEYVLDSMINIKKDFKLKLILVGNGGERDNLRALVEKNQIQDQVEFMGEVPREKLVEIYNISNTFVMASVNNEGNLEGTSIALIEAMACGLPVITTDIGGLKDIVRQVGEDLLVNEKDSLSIRDKIIKLYENKDLQKRLSNKSCHAAMNNYSLDSSINKVYDVYLQSKV